MTLTEARQIVRDNARNAAGENGQYGAARVDRAIKFLLNRLVRETRCLGAAAGQVALASGAATFSTAALRGFRLENLISARVDGRACLLELPGYDEVYRRTVACAADGTPTSAGFRLPAGGLLHPTPDASGLLDLRWWQTLWATWDGDDADGAPEFFPSGTVTGPTPDQVEFLIPEETLTEALSTGAPAHMQATDPEHGYAGQGWQRYLEIEQGLKGKGDMGQRTSSWDRTQF
jgi:hypothetical protein